MKHFALIFSVLVFNLSASFGDTLHRVRFDRSIELSGNLDLDCPEYVSLTLDSDGMVDMVLLQMELRLLAMRPDFSTLTSTNVDTENNRNMQLVRDQSIEDNFGIVGLTFNDPYYGCLDMDYVVR